MKDAHGGPDSLIEKYGRLAPKDILRDLKPRIKDRMKMLKEIYACHAKDWKGVYLNPHLLQESVESYFCDIYRLKFFRHVEWTDSHKQTAYAMKWIARVRPIQIHSGAVISPSVLMSNAYFAAISGLTILEAKKGDRDGAWWSRYINNMTYLLHYHSVPVEFLCSELFVLDTLGSRD